MDIKSTEDIRTILMYKDLRAVRRWCMKNRVSIIKQGKNEFVYESEFNPAFDKPIITKYKSIYGEDWERAYQALKNGDPVDPVPITQSTVSQYKRTRKTRRSPGK